MREQPASPALDLSRPDRPAPLTADDLRRLTLMLRRAKAVAIRQQAEEDARLAEQDKEAQQ